MSLSRIQSVDIFRLLAIVAVISIHTTPFDIGQNSDYSYDWKIGFFINQVARFAVPFFFVISGYFWGMKIRQGGNPIAYSLKSANRILSLLLFWCVIYLVPFDEISSSFSELGLIGPIKHTYWHINSLLQDPFTLIFQGTRVHLWFLISLVISILISSLFLYKQWVNWLILFSIMLYIFGIFAKSYVDTPVGINIEFNTRNGPFFGTILFVAGYYISGLKPNKKWFLYGFLIFFVGTIMHFAEITILFKLYGTQLQQDYVFGTLLMGVGVAIISLSNHPLLQSKLLASLGKLTLGVYASHFIFVELLKNVDKRYNSIAWEIGYVFIVLILSILLTILLSKFKLTRRFVV